MSGSTATIVVDLYKTPTVPQNAVHKPRRISMPEDMARRHSRTKSRSSKATTAHSRTLSLSLLSITHINESEDEIQLEEFVHLDKGKAVQRSPSRAVTLSTSKQGQKRGHRRNASNISTTTLRKSLQQEQNDNTRRIPSVNIIPPTPEPAVLAPKRTTDHIPMPSIASSRVMGHSREQSRPSSSRAQYGAVPQNTNASSSHTRGHSRQHSRRSSRAQSRVVRPEDIPPYYPTYWERYGTQPIVYPGPYAIPALRRPEPYSPSEHSGPAVSMAPSSRWREWLDDKFGLCHPQTDLELVEEGRSIYRRTRRSFARSIDTAELVDCSCRPAGWRRLGHLIVRLWGRRGELYTRRSEIYAWLRAKIF
ncbi:hypothetical protein EDC01DRAFT_631108 [Geopyxis carbonaria]|nr:hypothetical protein EDC01DRAFT_631108 [Geopyxis carbonaria]